MPNHDSTDPPESPSASHARVRTGRPARYGKQLVSHLTRRVRGEWSETEGRGWLDFGDARAELDTEQETLVLRLAASGERVPVYEQVLGSHLARFGARNELVVVWWREGGTPGSTQRHEQD